jgi:putative NADH-flavin reductase
MMSSVTVYGQLTPQRINYNGTKGVFFTDKQEEILLKSIVDYDYLRKSIAGKDEIIKTYELRIIDKDYEIKKAVDQLAKANQRTTDCLDKNAELYANLVGVRDSLEISQGNLGVAKRNNWIFGGISVFLLSILIITN